MTRPLVLLALLGATHASAADRYVELSGDDTVNDCTASASPCATLAHALEVSTAGDAIAVGTGLFSSTAAAYPLALPTGVSVTGAGADLTRINANTDTLLTATGTTSLSALTVGPTANRAFAITLDGPTAITLEGVTLQTPITGTGLNLSGSANAPSGTLTVQESTFDGGGLRLNSVGPGPWNVVLRGDTFTGVSGHVVRLRLSGTGTHPLTLNDDVTIQVADNTFHTNTANGRGNGDALNVLVTNGLNGKVSATHNTVTGPPGTALRVRADLGAFVTADLVGNTITDAKQGIDVRASSTATVRAMIRGNTVTNTTADAITALATSSTALIDADITDNTVTGAGGSGLYVGIYEVAHNAAHVGVTGNTIRGGAGDGVYVDVSSSSNNNVEVTLHNNTIANNAGDGVYLNDYYGAFRGELVANVITGNGANGVWATSSDVGFLLHLRHNTIAENAAGYTVADAYDLNMENVCYFDVLADQNWWGTTDRAVVDAHIFQANETGYCAGQVLYTTLDDALGFQPSAPSGPEGGGQIIAIHIDDGAPPFVWTAGDSPLTVSFDGVMGTPRAVSEDGHTLYVTVPAHAPGVVDVRITNPGGQSGTATFEYVTTDGFVDEDGDSVEDSVDNCLGLQNTDQTDLDGDGAGDACDDDDDGDGVDDRVDVCARIPDDQLDQDADGIGDACDPDRDDDGVDDLIDNCAVSNPDQADLDNDGIGDACDLDRDGDGVLDSQQGGCACTTGSPTPAAPLGLGLLALVALRRRRDIL